MKLGNDRRCIGHCLSRKKVDFLHYSTEMCHSSNQATEQLEIKERLNGERVAQKPETREPILMTSDTKSVYINQTNLYEEWK